MYGFCLRGLNLVMEEEIVDRKGEAKHASDHLPGFAILVIFRQIAENATVEPFEQSYQPSASSSSNEKV